MLKISFKNPSALKILSGSIEKGNRWYEFCYVDFVNSCIQFYNSRLRGKINLVIEGDVSSVDNIYVETEKLCLIASRYGTLDYEGGSFSSGKDKFQLQSFKEKPTPDVVDVFNEMEELSATPDEIKIIFSKIGNTIGYADIDKNSPFNGISIQGKWMIGTESTHSKMEASHIDSSLNLELPYDFVKVVYLGQIFNNNCRFYKDDKRIGLNVENDIYLLTSISANSEFPIFNDLKDNLMHKTSFLVKKTDLEEKVKLLQPFVKDILNQRVTFVITESELLLEVRENGNIDVSVEISNVSPEIVGHTFILSLEEVSKTIHVFNKSENIRVRESSEKDEEGITIAFEDEKISESGDIVILTKMI